MKVAPYVTVDDFGNAVDVIPYDPPWSPYPEPPPGNPVPDVAETDETLRGRIAEAYGRWGAFLSVVIESSGAALDECAAYVGLRRRGV